MLRTTLMEAIGTFFLVLAVAITKDPFAIGLTLMVMIYIGTSVSGAHYNPAATLAIWVRGACTTAQVIPYMVFQIIGAFLAAIAAQFLTGDRFAPTVAYTASIPQALLAEFLYTFALCSVILTLATARITQGNYIFGFAIGMTVTAGAYAVGPISGGVFNPAIALGPMLCNLMQGHAPLPEVWIHTAAPLGGGLVAALAFLIFHPEEK